MEFKSKITLSSQAERSEVFVERFVMRSSQKGRQSMSDHDGIKRSDQISMLETVSSFTSTGEWKGLFTYPNCGYDLIRQGLATDDKKITMAGRAALFLLGKGPDPTTSKAVEIFEISLADKSA